MKSFSLPAVLATLAGSLVIGIADVNANGIKETCNSSGGGMPPSSHDCYPEYGENGVDSIMINLFADRMFL